MVESSLRRHLLRFKNLPIAPWAALSVPVLPGQDRGVRGHDVSARPVQLVTADVAVEISVRTDSSDVNADRTGALATAHALLVVQPALDLHLLGGVDRTVAARTRNALVLAGNLAGVGVNLGRLILREGLLEAGLAVDLIVGAFINIVGVLERSGTLGAAEALWMPCKVLRQLSFHLKGFPLAEDPVRKSNLSDIFWHIRMFLAH